MSCVSKIQAEERKAVSPFGVPLQDIHVSIDSFCGGICNESFHLEDELCMTQCRGCQQLKGNVSTAHHV